MGSQHSTSSLLLGIWNHLNKRRRIQLGFLLFLMLISGVAELLSLGAVIPFLTVLSDPGLLWQGSMVRHFAVSLGFNNANQLILPASLALAFAAAFAAAIRLANLWLNGRIAAAVGSDLSCEAYRRTLFQPYRVHVQRNSSQVITATVTQINLTVAAVNALLQLITASVVAASLLLGLILVNWSIALSISVLFGSVYAWLAYATRRRLSSNGERISQVSNQQLKALQEGLGAIRDVLLDGTQSLYLEIYRRCDRPQRKLQAENQYLSAFPRYLLEAVAVAVIALVGGLLVLRRGSGAAVIPLLGALALGGQRLLPALQQVYSGWAALKGYNTAMADVLAMLTQPIPVDTSRACLLPFRQSLRLRNLTFSYGCDQPDVLCSVNLEIRPGERIGLIGATGSGKSTLVDLLMGLLEPSSGTILVDGRDIHDLAHPDRLYSWMANIAHVPQSIYLADSCIAENIAFGVPRHDIDMQRVRRAAEQAQIASFIESSDQGYGTYVGERGIRLSGGQRQRLGIARALYKQASFLVFDEATSALDNDTERAVMQAVDGLSRELTLVTIAHRLSTVTNCDRVIELQAGRILREVSGADLARL